MDMKSFPLKVNRKGVKLDSSELAGFRLTVLMSMAQPNRHCSLTYCFLILFLIVILVFIVSADWCQRQWLVITSDGLFLYVSLVVFML